MKPTKNKPSRVIIAICGAIIGFVNGFLGGGGGMICVPLQEKYCKIDNKSAHATTLCVILPLCIVSAFVYTQNVNLNFVSLSLITAGAIIGGILGAIFLKKLNFKFVRILFAFLMLFAGIKMVL